MEGENENYLTSLAIHVVTYERIRQLNIEGYRS